VRRAAGGAGLHETKNAVQTQTILIVSFAFAPRFSFRCPLRGPVARLYLRGLSGLRG